MRRISRRKRDNEKSSETTEMKRKNDGKKKSQNVLTVTMAIDATYSL